MANAILCSNDLVTDADTALVGSTAITNYPVTNLQVYQPGLAYRTETISACQFTATMSGAPGYETVGALYTNVGRSPNFFTYSEDLDNGSADWVETNLSVGTSGSGNLPINGCSFSHDVTCSGAAVAHSLDFSYTLPVSDVYRRWIVSMYVTAAGGAGNIALELFSGANYARVFFDLGTGLQGSEPETNGNWTIHASDIEAVTPIRGSLTWYRVYLVASNADATSGVGAKFYITDASNTLVHSDALVLGFSAPQLELSSTGSAPGVFSRTEDRTAAMWEVLSEDDDTGWLVCSNIDRTDLDYIHLVAQLDGSGDGDDTKSLHASVNIHDPTNSDGYIEVGNLVVAEAFQPAINIAAGHSITWSEQGDAARALGGQLYRPQNARSRILAMDHQFLTEAEAMSTAFELQRKVGRSRGVLASVDPGGTYACETTIWGLLDTPAPVVRRGYSSTLGGNVYQTNWEVIEALP